MPPSFELVVLGCSGGPNENNISAYLFKPFQQSWSDGIIGLEAGSGLGALKYILDVNPDLFSSLPDSTPIAIYGLVSVFLVTHAHLDHVQSLVLAAGSAGSGGVRKRVYAAPQTLEDLEGLFNGRIWPPLTSRNEESEDAHTMLLTPINDDGIYHAITPLVSIRRLPLSHGTDYESTAMFIKLDSTGHEFLFLGDVEPDSVAVNPKTIHVWRAAAPKIYEQTLTCIFLECSWPQGRSTDTLFGHLTPEFFAEELFVLANEVARYRLQAESSSSGRRSRKRRRMNTTEAPSPEAVDTRGALDGLSVWVMHCKDPMDGTYNQTRDLIVSQIKERVTELGVNIAPVIQGHHMEI